MGLILYALLEMRELQTEASVKQDPVKELICSFRINLQNTNSNTEYTFRVESRLTFLLMEGG